MADRKQFEFEIKEHLGTLTADVEAKVSKELNIVSWNGGKESYELRSWKHTENGKQPLKGITLTIDELKALRDCLNGLDLG